jgi:dipeptidyl aminopeptidase/acylaminoacyl peptidase
MKNLFVQLPLAVISVISFFCLHAQSPATYQQPPHVITDLVDGPRFPALRISPDKSTLVFLDVAGYPPIEELSEEELRLAGLRINPSNFGPSRSNYYVGMSIRSLDSEVEKSVSGLDDKIRITEFSFNNAGDKAAFVHAGSDNLQLYVVFIQEARVVKVADYLNSAMGSAYTWLDDDNLVYKSRSSDLNNKPEVSSNLSGPVIQESGGSAAPVRTYQDLLSSPYDEALYSFYTQVELKSMHVNSGEIKSLGIAGMIWGVSSSPDSKYLLVTEVIQPFSYIVPYSRFPSRATLYDRDGKKIQVFNESPLQENIPKGFNAVAEGKRSISWRSDKPATLSWVEALDGGDPAREVDFRDQVYMQDMPNGAVVPGPKTQLRYYGITWGYENLALIDEGWWATRRRVTSKWNPGQPDAPQQVLFDRSTEDRYNDPGSFVMTDNQYGRSVLQVLSSGNMLLTGTGASPEGNRPFIDEFNPSTLETNRLWRSEAPYYEYPVLALSSEDGVWITRRESNEAPPNYFIRNLKSNSLTALTNYENPYEALKGVNKEIVSYTRADGLKLQGTLYTPVGYDAERDGRLPVFMWAYPREFKSADAASQVNRSPYEFIRLGWGSALYWVTQGYAIFDDFSMPILGEGDEEPNETFVAQLRMSAEAAIDALVDMGVADRNRIAVGGHSYGAFMTANLLAHTNLFAAGIARSGAYNRTLTPFGFQSEQRTYWEAPEVYFNMSPFNYAHTIKTPILLIHGEADNNSGTFPMQSERFFAALKGHGVTSRLVMLPHESHGYRARESVLHCLYEMDRWLDVHVKNRVVEP